MGHQLRKHYSAAIGYYSRLQENAYNELDYCDARAFMKQLFQLLPIKQQRLCTWYFIEDYSYPEIARFTNLSPTTVKNHIAWSMIILRNYMTKPKAPV